MTQKILFVDTNIWLDFYRARTDAGISLLKHLEKIADQIIGSYQLEMEFKKNRQAAIREGFQDLKTLSSIPRPGFLSDAKAAKTIQTAVKTANDRIKTLKSKIKKAITDPGAHDPVYQVCQKVFHSDSALILKMTDPQRNIIKRRAFRRFIYGCPPRKNSDTSIGDAINWEWAIECAIQSKADLVIVSRDSDYGITFDDTSFINDHLRQEFSERVSRKRKIYLYQKLSDALKQFKIPVTKEEVQEENDIISLKPKPISKENWQQIFDFFNSAKSDDKQEPPNIIVSKELHDIFS